MSCFWFFEQSKAANALNDQLFKCRNDDICYYFAGKYIWLSNFHKQVQEIFKSIFYRVMGFCNYPDLTGSSANVLIVKYLTRKISLMQGVETILSSNN